MDYEQSLSLFFYCSQSTTNNNHFRVNTHDLWSYLINHNGHKEQNSRQHETSLGGGRLKGKGKGVLGARGTRGAREEGGREGNACQTIVFAIPPTNYVCTNNATVND